MRNNNFDFLRFIFAFVVLLVHMSILSENQELLFFQHYLSSYISVTAFFIISGYLIAQSYKETSTIGRYLLKRAARLLPAYLFVVIASAIFLSIISTQPAAEYFTNRQLYKYLFANITFQNYLQPCLPGVFSSNVAGCDVNGALWTLKIEVAFYITLPFVIYIAGKFRNKIMFFLSIYFLSVLYKLGLEYAGKILYNEYVTFLSRQLPGFYSYFISGVLIYYYKNLFIANKNWLLLIGLISYLIEKSWGWEFLSPFSLAIIVFWFAFSLKWLHNFAKFGDFSYGTYIYHYPIINLAVYFGVFEKYNTLVASFMVVLSILIISFFSWHLLEKPFLQRVRKTYT